MLLDEPTAALDIGHQQQALELLDSLREDDGLTLVDTTLPRSAKAILAAAGRRAGDQLDLALGAP